MSWLGHYILKGHEPVRSDDLLEWATWDEYSDRRVACDRVGPYEVSTVFLGLDHNFRPVGQPILFETMIFGPEPPDGLGQLRYCTWEEAEAGHAKTLARVQLGVCN